MNGCIIIIYLICFQAIQEISPKAYPNQQALLKDLDHDIPTFWLKLDSQLEMLILKKNFFDSLQTLPEYQNLISFLCDLQQQQDLSDLQKKEIGSFIPTMYKSTNIIQVLESDFTIFPKTNFFQFYYQFNKQDVYLDHFIDNSINMIEGPSRSLLQVALF